MFEIQFEQMREYYEEQIKFLTERLKQLQQRITPGPSVRQTECRECSGTGIQSIPSEDLGLEGLKLR